MEALYGLLASAFFGSQIEYWLHRALHASWFRYTWLGLLHLKHHQIGLGQPLLRELTDYLPIAVFGSPFGLFGSYTFLVGWVVGAFGYALLVAYVHNRAHARGDAFHESHHDIPTHNFGVVTSLWDRVFRTYRKPEIFASPGPESPAYR